MTPPSAAEPPRPIPPLAGQRLGQGLGRALRHANYRLFFTGQLVSLIGTWMQAVAQSWLVYRLTGSPAMLGLVTFTGQAPVLVFSLLGGSLADRRERRSVLVATQVSAMLLALILAGLTLFDMVETWQVFVLAAGLGVVNAVDVPTRQSFVAELVEREDLLNAIALNSTMFNAARMVGPALAGLLVAAVGEGWCFLLNGLSYVAVIYCLTSMRLAPKPALVEAASRWGFIREGFFFAWKNPPVRTQLLLLGTVSLMGMPYSVLMPVIADSFPGGGPQALGFLMGASGLGALMGALYLASRKGASGLSTLIFAACLGFGASLILFSLATTLFLALVLVVPVGFAMIVGLASANSLIQLMTPDELRGRIMSLYSMMLLGMAPFGALLAGSLATTLGARATVALGGGACMVAAVLYGLKLPRLRIGAQELVASAQRRGGKTSD